MQHEHMEPEQMENEHTEKSVTARFVRPDRFVDAGDERLAYWRFGNGPDVVLVHGWPIWSATFRRIIPALAQRFTLHAFDLPGAGHTKAVGRVELRAHGRTLRRAIDALGLERYAMIAHDSGGAVARLAAADDPRVRGLVLGNTEIPGHHPWLIAMYVAALKVPRLDRGILASMRLGPVRRSFLGFGGCFRDPAYVDGDFGELFVRPLTEGGSKAQSQLALLRDLDFSVLDELASVHARIQAPVRCIWGTDDPFFPLHKARRMLPQFAGGAELLEIAGAKLFAHEDHPAEFVAHALPFLERCLRTARPHAA